MLDHANITLRFSTKIEVDIATGCWNWTAYKYHGYGILNVKGKPAKAHRISYELYRGPIGKLIVCHTCDNRACVNPNHLYLGTYYDNNHDIKERRGHHNSNKTHCKNGHPYSPENTILSKKGGRSCRFCYRDYQREYQCRVRQLRRDAIAAFGKLHKGCP